LFRESQGILRLINRISDRAVGRLADLLSAAASALSLSLCSGGAEGRLLQHPAHLPPQQGPVSVAFSDPERCGSGITECCGIFASVPRARRVMINNQNLRPGENFRGLRVEEITGDGMVLSRQRQQFRLGTVRDWTSPR
jgi:hypothetical protein